MGAFLLYCFEASHIPADCEYTLRSDEMYIYIIIKKESGLGLDLKKLVSASVADSRFLNEPKWDKQGNRDHLKDKTK